MTNNQIPMTNMKTLIQIFTIVAMSALPVWLSGCGGGNADPHAGHNHGAHGDEAAPETVTLSDEIMAKYKITTGSVKLQILRATFNAPARVAFNAETMAHVGTLVAGRVDEMKVRLGDTVEKDAVLFTIKSPELGAAQNAFLKALDTEAAAGPAVVLAQNNAGVAQAEAEGKAAEAMLTLANNPAMVALVQGKLDAAKPVLQRATELFASGKKLAAEGALAGGEGAEMEATWSQREVGPMRAKGAPPIETREAASTVILNRAMNSRPRRIPWSPARMRKTDHWGELRELSLKITETNAPVVPWMGTLV